MTKPGPTVFVVDDDVSVRESLTNLFRSVRLNVAIFSTAQEFINNARDSGPACLVLDVRLPGLSGLDLQRHLAGMGWKLPIVFISGHADIPMSVKAIKAGAVEFLTKPFRDQDLLDAVRQAIEGDKEVRIREHETMELRERYEALTIREREVMEGVARGLLNKQIAGELGISEATVKLHRGRVMHKMKARTLADLIKLGERLGIS